jgi:ATP-dependent Clp protease ATP-binding subunit ClpC
MGQQHMDWSALLPSQLALPDEVLAYRHLRGELLFRARQLAAPPRLSPTVILLDVTPPSFGPIEAITRLAAYIVARSLLQAGMPAMLVLTGQGVRPGEQIRELRESSDLLEVWTARTLSPAKATQSLRLASVVRAGLRDGGVEPVILLLTQAWFGAEEEVARVAGLRALFVQYPGQQVRPAMAAMCERWHSVNPTQINDIGTLLSRLLLQ